MGSLGGDVEALGSGRDALDISAGRLESSVLAEIRSAAAGPAAGATALVALDADGQRSFSLTYAQLMAWADEVADRIAEVVPALGQATAEEDASPRLVALVMDRSALVVASILGVWQLHAGIVTVPPDAPAPRIAEFCQGVRCVLADGPGRVPPEVAAPVAVLSPRPLEGRPRRTLQGRHMPSPDATCMVVYTSGSTGQPKGVVVSHRSLWHSVLCYGESVSVSSSSRLLWKTPYQWRTAEYELYPALAVGGTLYVAAEGAQRRLDYIIQAVDQHGICALTTVPSVLIPLTEMMREAGAGCASLAHVSAVGEPLPSKVCQKFLGGPGPQLRNYYGLTETGMATWACRRIPEGPTAPAGHPQPHVGIHLLQSDGSLAAPDGEGEIHFAGLMADRYLNDAELTAGRFVRGLPAAGGCLFRSGDLGRRNARGELLVLGRIDRQIKLNGVRIELGEIEAALLEHCSEACVVPAEEDGQTLVAFVVRGSCGKELDLKAQLRKRLPAYMVPVHVISTDILPRLPSQKVDSTSLRTRTRGLMTRAKAQKQLEDGGAEASEVVQYIDSLGRSRMLSVKKVAARRLWDNVMVLAMANVILYHWFWPVLVEPRTYVSPPLGASNEYRLEGNSVAMPQLPVAPWAMLLYRIMTQEWVNGAFVLAAVQVQTPEELTQFTSRDLGAVVLYLYMGLLPVFLSFLTPAPYDEIVLRAETVQRWFLLALVGGKAILVMTHRLGVRPTLPMALLLTVFVAMPPCLEDMCGSQGAEYLLPTDWWPRCTSCLLMPKEVDCMLLYLAAAHFQPFELLQRLPQLPSTFVFFVGSLLGVWLPGQASIEFGADSSTWLGRFTRLIGLVLTVLQAVGLVGALSGLSKRIHLRWATRWVLGCYLFNLNFLDLMLLPPDARRSILAKVQVGGPILSGILTWMAMLTPLVFFVLVGAPLMQTLLIIGPVQAALKGWVQMRRLHHCMGRALWSGPRAGAWDARKEPLLGA